MRIGTDCSGIEAPVQALRMLGINYEHVFSCDIDKYVKKVSAEIYKPQIWYDNLMERDNTQAPEVDLYVAGFPCQAFSIAGKRKGFDDIRGSVFFGVADYIRQTRPKMFVLENVKGLLSHDKGRTMQTVLEVLAGSGTINGQMSIPFYDDGLDYHLYWQVLNTKDHGIPQNRERVFLVGFRDYTDYRFPIGEPLKMKLKDLLEDQVDDKYFIQSTTNELIISEDISLKLAGNLKGGKWDKIHESARRYYSDTGIAPAIPTCSGGNTEPKVLTERIIRKLTPLECFRVQGFPDVLHEQIKDIGISDTQLYKMAGNSMTVHVMADIINKMIP